MALMKVTGLENQGFPELGTAVFEFNFWLRRNRPCLCGYRHVCWIERQKYPVPLIRFVLSAFAASREKICEICENLREKKPL